MGTFVKVLSIDSELLSKMEHEERTLVESMLGGVFEVYEIDTQNQAWVEKWWHEDKSNSISHSLGLRSTEMLVVESGR